jgi:hypothetical protein
LNVAIIDSGSPLCSRVIRDIAELPIAGKVTVVTRDLAAVASSDVVVSCDAEGRFDDLVETFATGKTYISACETVQGVETLVSLHSKASEAGALVIPGAGFSPGLTSVMASAAIAELEDVRSVRISWMASADESFGTLVDRMARTFSGNAVLFRNGQWERKPAGGEEEEVYFPPPVGWRTVRLAGGPECLTMPGSFPGLESLVVKAGVTEGAIGLLTRAISGLPPTRGPLTRDRLVRVGGRFLPTIGRMSGSRQTWSAARVDAYGSKEGSPATVTVGVLDQLSNLIAASLVTTVMLAAKGGLTGEGVVPAEKMIAPMVFLEALAERGVRTARLNVA